MVWLKRAFGALGLVISCYLGAAVALGLLPVNRDFAPARDGIEIAITSNGFHTDLFLPMRTAGIDWSDWCPPISGDGAARFVGFGWGDRRFYLETPSLADLRLRTALHAVWFSSDVVLHVEYVDDLAQLRHPHRLTITPAAYRTLAGHVRASFRLDDARRPIRRPEPGYGPADGFYAGRGTYSPLETCNEWLAEGLRAAGIRTGWWAPFAFDITAHL